MSKSYPQDIHDRAVRLVRAFYLTQASPCWNPNPRVGKAFSNSTCQAESA